MRQTRAMLLSGVLAGFALGLALGASAWGRDAAQPAWRGHLALVSRGHPGLALPGYGAVLVSQVVQGDSKPDSSPSGTSDGLATEEQGRDALATAEALQEPAGRSGGPLLPVTAAHQGRLLVLTYGPKSGAGALASSTGGHGDPPRFAVYRGRRQIASGQFEYG